jgi:O-antigen/teichoic acid export membrane protein
MAAYPLMFVMSISLLARSAVGPAERALSMLGEQRICALIYATAFALNMALAFSLAPHFGGMGVAVALAAAVVTESVLLFVTAKRRLGLHLFVWQPRAKP